MNIVLTASFRPWYLDETLDSWARVRGLSEIEEFTVFIEPSDWTQQALDVCRKHPFVEPILHTERQGVLRCAHTALMYAFEMAGADEVLLAEEDLVVSEDVLEYHRWALSEFASDPTVLCVNSWTMKNGALDEVELVQQFSPWVWSTWADRWERLRDTWDFDYSTGNPDGTQAGWDWNIDKRLLPRWGMVVVRPRMSRVNNIGRYGVHAQPALFDEQHLPDFQMQREPVQYRLI